MNIATPAIQINSVDLSASPSNTIIAQTGGQPLTCPHGVVMQDTLLSPGADAVALSFPTGVTTAVFVFIAALTAIDLIVNVGTETPVPIVIPARQGIILYGLTSEGISLSSVTGGQVQYAIGG